MRFAVILADCRLLIGQTTKVFFKHRKLVDQASVSFSLVSSSRSVDVYASDRQIFLLWVEVLKDFVQK
jgi:hypothetical protein